MENALSASCRCRLIHKNQGRGIAVAHSLFVLAVYTLVISSTETTAAQTVDFQVMEQIIT